MKRTLIKLIGILLIIIFTYGCSNNKNSTNQVTSIKTNEVISFINKDFAEQVEMLISNVNGKLVVSDWYIRFGAGSSSFDEKFRPNESINSPIIWDNKEYVNKVFKKAGIN